MFEAAQWAEISAVSFQISTDDQPTANGSHVEGLERDMPGTSVIKRPFSQPLSLVSF